MTRPFTWMKLFCIAGCLQQGEPPPVATSATREALSATPESVRAAVADHVQQMVANGAAPHWAGATFSDEVDVIRSPGTKTATYFEFHLVAGEESRGYVIARNQTTVDGALLVRWADEGTSPIDDERAQATAPIAALYLIDPLTAAAEDAGGNLLGAPRDFVLRDGATARVTSWAELNAPTPVASVTPECNTCQYTYNSAVVRSSNVGGAVPLFSQLAPNQAPNTSSCWSGCGPEAWTMDLAWISNEAARNPTGPWAGYMLNGALPRASSGGALYDNAATQAMSLELHNELDTMCFNIFGTGFVTDQAPTWPDDMVQVASYFDAHGIRRPTISSDSMGDTAYLTGFRSQRYASEAAGHVDAGQPAVLGLPTSGGDHYGLVLQHQLVDYWYTQPDSCTCGLAGGSYDMIYVAPGWGPGSPPFWLNTTGLGSFYAAALYPPPAVNDCTVTGCGAGKECCTCNSPAVCTTVSACNLACKD